MGLEPKRYVIGTAGHIDHGKTMLTRVLTGVNTDRLKEEQERNISIEPGFAPLTLPSGLTVSIIDVPGHEKLIRQMVAGVAGIDFVLLVVAADEGVMPQTREHLSILDLLGVKNGLLLLSKIDRADPDLLPIIEEDLRGLTRGTFLEGAPLLRISSATGEGIDHLLQVLDEKLPCIEQRKSEAPFRLPVDRSFIVKGAGTVVTGTVQSGSTGPGEELEVLPGGKRVKVRQAQVHSQTVPIVQAGQRAALNLSGINREEVFRGQTVVQPGIWSTSRRIDIRAVSLPELDFSLRQRSLVTLMIGTSEVFAELILYDRKEWKPGEEIYASLVLREPVVAAHGERFILRRPTPATTIGGGEVAEAAALKRKISPASAEEIRQVWVGGLTARILRALDRTLLLTFREIQSVSGEGEATLHAELKALEEAGRILPVASGFASVNTLTRIGEEMTDWLISYHREHPMIPGVPKAEWSARFLPDLDTKEVNTLLAMWEKQRMLIQRGEYISLHSFTPDLPARWKPAVAQVMNRLQREGWTPTEWETLLQEAGIPAKPGEDIRGYLIREATLVPLTEKLLMHREAYDRAVDLAAKTIRREGSLSMQLAKECFGLSRKYLVPLLELMDKKGITRRVGDKRILIQEEKASR